MEKTGSIDQPHSNPSFTKTPLITVALLPWGDLFEDFFDTIGVSFETFRDEYIGSYTFGYINALKTAGVRTVLLFVSVRVTEPLRFIHKPTETQVCILPASRAYRIYYKFRQKTRGASGVKEDQKFSEVYTADKPHSSLLLGVKDTIKSLGSYLSIPWRVLANELRREGCTAILCQEYEHPRFDICVLLGKFLKLPVLATFQGGNAPQSWVEQPFRSLALRSCEKLIIAPEIENQRVQASYNIAADKIARIFNPIDLAIWQTCDRQAARKSLDISSDAQVIVWHGRIEIERKGLDVLLEAWQQVCEKRPRRDLRLLLVGTGSDASKLRERITAMQLRGIVWVDEFISNRSILRQYLCAADLYTLPSRHEGFPVAPLEAMACGLPVVATDAPGVPDIFERGEASGGIVVPRENVVALADALGQVLDDDVMRQELGKLARLRVEQSFSLQSVGQQLKNCLAIQSSIQILGR